MMAMSLEDTGGMLRSPASSRSMTSITAMIVDEHPELVNVPEHSNIKC